jgi:3-deoxy-D-manno-octulosonate 8-phosphate phosphatase (KDO 8-P phosphatase)
MRKLGDLNLNYNIKIAVFDVDGCFTDGKYTVSDQGDLSKSFYTRDFYAIELLLKKGLEVFIISESIDEVIIKQINRLQKKSIFWKNCIEAGELNIITGIDNKKRDVESLFEYEEGWDNVAYMGDAENDFECMKVAKITGCPKDAIEEIKNESNYQSLSNGGDGAVYDFCHYVLDVIKDNIKD